MSNNNKILATNENHFEWDEEKIARAKNGMFANDVSSFICFVVGMNVFVTWHVIQEIHSIENCFASPFCSLSRQWWRWEWWFYAWFFFAVSPVMLLVCVGSWMPTMAVQHLSIPLEIDPCARATYVCVCLYAQSQLYIIFPGGGWVTCRQFAACSTIHARRTGVGCMLWLKSDDAVSYTHAREVENERERGRKSDCVDCWFTPAAQKRTRASTTFPMFFSSRNCKRRNNCKGDNGLSGFHGNFIIYLFVGNLV